MHDAPPQKGNKNGIETVILSGDSCYNPISMGSIKNLINETVPNIYIKMVCIGKNLVEVSLLIYLKNY